MKKAFVFISLIILFLSPLAAQSITVTSPAAGAQWCQGTGYSITWTSAGVSGPVAIKLRLANAPDAPPVLDIVASTSNSGSFSWPVPASVPVGSYVVRVRTVSDSPLVYDDSDAFTIKACGAAVVSHLPDGQLPPVMLQLPRLEVSDIDLVANTEGFGIVFSYKNTGNGALPQAADVPIKPSYRVLVDGKETTSGSLFIPAFAAPPGWEQKGYFGGWIVMPVNLYDNKLWHIGNIVTVHINENKAIGMDRHSLSLNLRPIALKYAYDVIFTNVAFDWGANELAMSVRVDGQVPPGKKLRFHCPGEFDHDVDIHPGQGLYSYSHKLIYKPPKNQTWTKINALAYLVPLPGGGERLWDIDLRNNQGMFQFQRPTRLVESQN